MALLWIEGFEGLGTSVDSALPASGDVFARKYANLSGSMSSVYLRAGRLAGYSVQGTYNVTAYFRTPILPNASMTAIQGLGFKPNVTGSGAWPVIMRFISSYAYAGLGVNLYYDSASHEIKVYMGASTLLGTSSGANITSAGWSYVETKVTVGYYGSIEIRVNGSTVYTQINVDTRPGGYNNAYDQFGWEFSGGARPAFYDDWYVCNNAGTSNNDFLGDCKVVAVYPVSDAGANQWTPSGGSSHNALVADNPANDDTSYLESSTSGQKELWGFGTLSGLGSIVGVQVNTDVRETDGTSHSLRTLVSSGATESEDTGQAVGLQAYVTKARVVALNPDNSQPWTVTSLNAAKFGIKVG